MSPSGYPAAIAWDTRSLQRSVLVATFVVLLAATYYMAVSKIEKSPDQESGASANFDI